MEKTNVMRILDQKKIEYKAYEYPHTDEAVDGMNVALSIGEDPNTVFKTIVLISPAKKNYVAMVPVNHEIDLKKVAASFNEKKLETLPLKDLLPLTGYVRGGCSPIGMKKPFRAVIHNSASNLDEMIFSAGKIGYQVALKYKDLEKVIQCSLCDIIKEN